MSAAEAEIAIGVAGPMSGQYASFGAEQVNGVKLAIDAINAAGGINGENLAMVTADDACDTKRALDAARDFIAKDVRLVVGHFCSGSAQAAALLYRDAGILMITPAATAPALTEAGYWNVFRTTGRDDAQAVLAAARLAKAKNTKLAIVSDGSPTAKALVQRLQAAIPAATVLALAPAADLRPVLAALQEQAPTAIYAATGPGEAARLVNGMVQTGITAQVLGADALVSDDLTQKLVDTPASISATFPQDPAGLPKAASLAPAFAALNAKPEGATLPAHAAVEAFAAAAKATSVNDAKAMASWLKSAPSIDTALGPIAFDAKGDLRQQPFVWYRLQAGSFVPEEP